MAERLDMYRTMRLIDGGSGCGNRSQGLRKWSMSVVIMIEEKTGGPKMQANVQWRKN